MPADAAAASWGRLTPGFMDDLAHRLHGRRVLEVFAGSGLLAAGLARRGIRVTATSLFSGHDGHARGLAQPVAELDAAAAVAAFGADADVLLMCWPTVTEAALRAALAWGADRDIVFIGEVTDYSRGHLGGCATDGFFAATRVVAEIGSYQPRNMLERAVVMRVRPGSGRGQAP